jgi:hypothetical protein
VNARRYVTTAVTAMVLALVGVGAWFVHERDRTTAFGLTDALRSLRTDAHPTTAAGSGTPAIGTVSAGTSATPAPSPSPGTTPSVTGARTPTAGASAPVSTDTAAAFEIPAAGVYAYATSGYDAISPVSSRHTYPAETYAVLQHAGGCRWDVDHHVVDQHVDHVARCSQPGELLRVSDASRVTFFGQTDGLTYVCAPPVSMWADATCAADDGSQVRYHATIVDHPTLTIGGVVRTTVHLVDDIAMTGRARGTARNEMWLDAATGLLLRQVRDVDTIGRAAFGDVHYTEHVEFTLENFVPQR